MSKETKFAGHETCPPHASITISNSSVVMGSLSSGFSTQSTETLKLFSPNFLPCIRESGPHNKKAFPLATMSSKLGEHNKQGVPYRHKHRQNTN